MAGRTLHSVSHRALAAALVAVACSACASSPGRSASLAPAPCTNTPPVAWSVSSSDPRRVTVQLDVLSEASAAWRVDGVARMREALRAWNRAGIPVKLSLAERGESVDIRVFVVRRIPIDPADGASAFRAGVTHLRYDATGAIDGAQVMIAEETPRGLAYSSADQSATLLHELGHALGVPHSGQPFALMSPRTVAVSLTPHDVALAHTVYAQRACTGDAVITASRPF